ncbi:hypothetical protein C8T65DRAFT_658992 [Cerioporus squamosus]|nr:hypothetical protein C8T65DRAFT_658992 [Cerioporus squamosus]
MISRLVARVLPRPSVLNVATAVGLRVAPGARQHAVARTFLTTAHVSEPAAKEGTTKSKAPKSTSTKAKSTKVKKATKTAAAKKAPTKKKPAKKAGRPPKDDSEARFRKGLMSVKVKRSELPPVKPISPYSLFVREQYKNAEITGSFGEKSTEIAARWKQLSEEEKESYREKAESLKEQFAKEQEEWYKTTDPRILRAINAQRKAHNKLGIRVPQHLRDKRPLSPYMMYMVEVRDSVELDLTLPRRDAIMKQAGQVGKMWQDLPAEEKQRYADKFKKAIEEYRAKQSANA